MIHDESLKIMERTYLELAHNRVGTVRTIAVLAAMCCSAAREGGGMAVVNIEGMGWPAASRPQGWPDESKRRS